MPRMLNENKAISNHFLLLMFNNKGSVSFSIKNIYIILEKINTSEKFPYIIDWVLIEVRLDRVIFLFSCTPCVIISIAFCKELALKKIHAKQTEMPVNR